MVRASISYTLTANVERLILTGSNAIDGTGNGLADRMSGNGAANRLDGAGGHDQLFGLAGNDCIGGNVGNDTLSGGAGADMFVFGTALSRYTNVDRISDFSAADDTIELHQSVFTALARGTLSADAFRTGTAAQDANDRIIYDSSTGKIFYDADGNGAGAQVLFAQVNAGQLLTNADFLVVG